MPVPQLHGTSFERLIQLVEIDLTGFGDEVRRFVDSSTYATDTPELGSLSWGGHTWLPAAFQTGGYARGGENLVKPTIEIADFTGELYSLLQELDFAPGAPVTRYEASADDIESSNPFAVIITEKYVLNKCKSENMVLKLELSTTVDQAQKKIPGHTMHRDEYPGLGSAILRG